MLVCGVAVRRVPVGRRVWLVGGLLAFMALTNRWMSWQGGFQLLRANDEIDYRAIALAAPHLPAVRLQEQHAQRFPFHYLLGLISSASGISVESLYLVGVLVVAGLLCLVLARVLDQIGLGEHAFVLCMGLFILNTYSLRYYVLAPGEIADLLLGLGILVMVLGLLDGRLGVIIGGVALAALARQTALPASLAAAGWLWFSPRWRHDRVAVRAGRALSVVGVAGGIYALEVLIATPFSSPTTPGLTHFTFLAELAQLPAGVGVLGQHFLRCVNGLFAVGALLLVVFLVTRRWRPKVPLPFEFWACLLVGLSIFLQPVVFSAQYAKHNETRLAVMALPPLICTLAIALRQLQDRGWQLARRELIALILVLAAGSIHHLYTTIRTGSAAQSVLLQALAATAAAAIMIRSLNRTARQEPPRTESGQPHRRAHPRPATPTVHPYD